MFIKRFCARERQTLLALQRFSRVPTFYPEVVPTGIAMKRYDMDLLEAMDHGVTPTPVFARCLFGFLGTLHDDVGMFHGDIKPENICVNLCHFDYTNVTVDIDSWVLVDWESARAHGATFTGPYTPDYGPPHEAPSASGDVFSATVTLLVARERKPPTVVRDAFAHSPHWGMLLGAPRNRPTAKEAADLPWGNML
jgi:hypothetical protein